MNFAAAAVDGGGVVEADADRGRQLGRDPIGEAEQRGAVLVDPGPAQMSMRADADRFLLQNHARKRCRITADIENATAGEGVGKEP